MKQKRDGADSELERTFDFSKARPNPYLGWSRRAKGRPSPVPGPAARDGVPISLPPDWERRPKSPR